LRDFQLLVEGISVTGVLFFDFIPARTGQALPHSGQDVDRRDKVDELYPMLCNEVNGYRARAGKPAC
jgi:hypothetical protein